MNETSKPVMDMNGDEIKVGTLVRMYPLIGAKYKAQCPNFKERKVWHLGPMHGTPTRQMVWCTGEAAHHPLACEVVK